METRRLRLSVVAYLRGLLEPYYERGLLSFTRENLVLDALDKELTSEAIKHSSLIDASIMPIHKNQTGLYQRMYDKIRQSRMMSEMSPYERKPVNYETDEPDATSDGKKPLTNKQQELIDTFKLLKETGVWGQIEKDIFNK